jgi:hypothetical protein
MGFNLLKTRGGKLENTIKQELAKAEPDLSVIMSSIHEYEKSNLATIEKLKRDKKLETNRINGALKQTIQAHSAITMTLIGSATKRIYGALLNDEKSKKEKFCDKISSIYHTFKHIMIFIIKLEFMKNNKDKICVTISKENNEKLVSYSINKSKLIDKLLTEYFKKK